jgi:hypothetical protein
LGAHFDARRGATWCKDQGHMARGTSLCSNPNRCIDIDHAFFGYRPLVARQNVLTFFPIKQVITFQKENKP